MSTPERAVHQPTVTTSSSRLRTARTVAGWALVVLVVVLAWPQRFGGDTGYVLVASGSMQPELRQGALVVTRQQDDYRVGDVVDFRIPEGDVGGGRHVIHRIVGGDPGAGFVTQGDANAAPDPWRPRPGDITGRATVHLPGAARAFLVLTSPLLMLGLVGIGVVIAIWPSRPHDNESDPDEPGSAPGDRDAEAHLPTLLPPAETRPHPDRRPERDPSLVRTEVGRRRQPALTVVLIVAVLGATHASAAAADGGLGAAELTAFSQTVTIEVPAAP